jgi:uncharacterized membrane protein
MSYKCILDCFELLMLAAALFAVGLTGCASVHHKEIDGRPVRVTRSHPALVGVAVGATVLGVAAGHTGEKRRESKPY